jgi:hypothetical protein
LVELTRLTLVALYEEAMTYHSPAIWLAGVRGRRVPWGVRFDVGQFRKSIPSLECLENGNVASLGGDLREVGVRMAQLFRGHGRCNPRELPGTPTLPRLWAAFRQAEVRAALLGGPELEAACAASGKSAVDLLDGTARRHRGLLLVPLDWVSGHWQRFVEVYADLDQFPDTQVFAIEDGLAGLRGFQGAAAFDFSTPGLRRRRMVAIGPSNTESRGAGPLPTASPAAAG